MISIFWDSETVLMIDYLPIKTTIRGSSTQKLTAQGKHKAEEKGDVEVMLPRFGPI